MRVLALAAAIGFPASAAAIPVTECPDPALFRGAATLYPPTPTGWSSETIGFCYAALADELDETDVYGAEKLYLRAVELAPRNPKVLEAIARYYRVFRGSRGLFAESEAYYLRARSAVDDALKVARESGNGSIAWLEELREWIVRGRIELNKREGLGLFIPSEPGDALGIYLGSGIEYGEVPIAHNDLATPARTLLKGFPSLDTRDLLREPVRLFQRYRLRLRYGALPYVDLAWNDVNQSDAIARGWIPVQFADFKANDLEAALEDTMGIAPFGDLFWRLEYRRSDIDPEGPGKETVDRGTVAATFTRSFGRVKADLDLLGSFASLDLHPGGTDRDRTYAASLRLLHFPGYETTKERVIDPRGYEYLLGAVRHTREFGDTVELFQDTLFGGLKLTEVIPRTDLQVLTNFFRNEVKGTSREDSSDVEINVIIVHRIVDLVNNMSIRQAERPVGLAQWAVSLRLFEDISTGSLDDFESRGTVLSSSVELFSGPMNRTTVTLEPIYEVRHYHHLNRVQHMFRLVFRMGF